LENLLIEDVNCFYHAKKVGGLGYEEIIWRAEYGD